MSKKKGGLSEYLYGTVKGKNHGELRNVHWGICCNPWCTI